MPRAVFRRHSQRRTAPRHPSHQRRAALRHSVLRCVHRPLERPASQAVAAKSLDPGFRLRRPRDDIKNKTSSPPVRPTLDVIPDGAQRPHSVPPTTRASIRPSSRMVRSLTDVIPDGAQRRAGIQRSSVLRQTGFPRSRG